MKDLMNTFPVKVGDKVIVKYVGLNSQGNHMISRKALLPPPTKVCSIPRYFFYESV